MFTGLPFLDREDEALTKAKKIDAAKDYIAKADDEESRICTLKFMCEPDEDYVQELIDEQMEDTTREDIEKMILEYYPEYASMLSQMDDDMLFTI